MAQPAEPQLTVRFPRSLFAGLERRAIAYGVSRQEVVVDAVRAFLARELSARERAQAAGEAVVMKFVEETAKGLAVSGDWGEDAIHVVFERVKASRLPDYSAAIGGDPFAFGNPEKSRINRNVGKRIKAILGAVEVRDNAWRIQKGQPGRGSLVLSYTKLRRA
jgi:hypothetical protein